MDPLALMILLGHLAEQHQEAEFNRMLDQHDVQHLPEVLPDRCTAMMQNYLIDRGFDGEHGPSCYWNHPIPDDDGGCRAFAPEELTVCFRIVEGACNAVFSRWGDDTLWLRHLFGWPQWKGEES
jgi:hypothetical protein